MGLCFGSDPAVNEALAKYQAQVRAHRAQRARQTQAEQNEREELSLRILSDHRERPLGYPSATLLRPSLLLGSLYDALDTSLLKREGVTHAINATRASLPVDGIHRLGISIEDDPNADIFPHLTATCQFIQEALEHGGFLLIHCEQGVSRSATIATAFLMSSERRAATDVLAELKRLRPIVNPNEGFLTALVEWEASLHLGSEASTLQVLNGICHPKPQDKRPEMLPG